MLASYHSLGQLKISDVAQILCSICNASLCKPQLSNHLCHWQSCHTVQAILPIQNFRIYNIFISADDWLAGKNASPVLISMKTGSKTRTYKPVMYKPSEQAIVVSDRNNDRKFMFLSEETKPDYRPKEQRTESRPSPAIDHRPYGADKYQV